MRLRLLCNATQRLHYAGRELVDLRAQARTAGIPDARLLIPVDGETLEL